MRLLKQSTRVIIFQTKEGGRKKMKHALSVFSFMLCVFLALMPANSVAQDDVESFYSYGEVLSVMQDQVMIREFDYATGEEKDVVYFISSATTFDMIESADQIKPGDLIDVEFVVSEDGRNIASEIFVDNIEDFEQEEIMD
jgi:hypothetical protein